MFSPTVQGSDSDTESAEIRSTAMRYLARREHSRLELIQKLLSKRYACHKKIHQVLDSIKEKGYQSDERYADLVVRSRINQLCGPFKIKMELKGKGVSGGIVDSVIDSYDTDWVVLARQARDKHFGIKFPSEAKIFAKQVRYLKNKGFYQEHIDQVIRDMPFV